MLATRQGGVNMGFSSPEMSQRLARAFGSCAGMWLGLQMDYDLAQAQKKAGKIKVQNLHRGLRC